jgi:O-antigen/teichoic acid export membrane protein
VSFPIFAVTFTLAEPAITTVYGEQYRESATFLSLLAVGYYVQAALGFNGTTLVVFGRVKLIFAVNLAAVIVNVALNLVLIPAYGALGAAIGTAVTLVLHNVFKQTALHVGTSVTFFDRSYLRMYVSIAAAMAVLAAARAAETDSVPVLVVLTMAASAVVLLANRRLLRIGETFPELRRLPLAGRIFGE